jgi:hypothetical protein
MKPESLHALVIDHHAGELPPEVADLLEAFLTTNASAREEADRLLNALDVTSRTVKLHPELSRCMEPILPPKVRQINVPMWLKAAAVIALAALTSVGGFFAGKTHSGASTIASSTPLAVRKDSPWAKYRMAVDPGGGGMQVVRVDLPQGEVRP